MSYYPNAKINLSLDPCLPKDVEGDIVKFNQIIISLIDFALKSSNSVNINSQAIYDMKLGGFVVHFHVSFLSEIIFNEEDLNAIFNQQDEYFMQSVKNHKSLGLALNLTARLLQVINGSFNKVTQEGDGRMKLSFEIPFKMADFSNNPYIQVHRLQALLEPNFEDGIQNQVDTLCQEIQTDDFQVNQESGNGVSFRVNIKECRPINGENIQNSLINHVSGSDHSSVSENKPYNTLKKPTQEVSSFKIVNDRLAKTQVSAEHAKHSPEMRLTKANNEQESGDLVENSKSSEVINNEVDKSKKVVSKQVPKELDSLNMLSNITEELCESSMKDKSEINGRYKTEKTLLQSKINIVGLPQLNTDEQVHVHKKASKESKLRNMEIMKDSASNRDMNPFTNDLVLQKRTVSDSKSALYDQHKYEASLLNKKINTLDSNDGTPTGDMQSKVRMNLLSSITEGIRCSKITKSKINQKKRKKSLVVESNSERSISMVENKDMVEKNVLKRMITFSSEVDQYSKSKIARQDSSIVDYEECDEKCNLSEVIRGYDFDETENAQDLYASKHKMNLIMYKKSSSVSSQGNRRRYRKHNSMADQALNIFGLNSEMQRVPSKNLVEKESPKFSTCSDKDDSSKGKKLKKSKKSKNNLSLLRPSTFSSQKIGH